MKKYENFIKAYNNLSETSDLEPPYNTVTLTGLVGLFEITFEQAWKMIKEILDYHGYGEGASGSPRIVLKTAYGAGMINDEEAWLDMLYDRNNVAHSYNENVALGIVKNTKEKYIKLFGELKKEIEEKWL